MIIFTDANPKMYAIVVEGGGIIVEKFDSPKTNNQAEYLAVIAALKQFNHPEEIRSDSELVVKQLNKEYHIKDDTLRGLALQAWILAQGK